MSDEIVNEEIVEESMDESFEEGDVEESVEGEDLDALFAKYNQEHPNGLDEDEEIDEDAEDEDEEQVEVFKLKINGEEVEKSRDEVIALAQKAEASSRKFEEATNIVKNIQDALHAAKEQPLEFLESLGVDSKNFILDQAERILEESDLSPEEMELKKKETALQEKERKLKEEQEAREMAALEQKVVQDIENDIADAIEQSGVKPNRMMLANMARVMLNGLEEGKEVSARDALRIVKEHTQQELNSYLLSSDASQLVSQLPKEFVEGLRKHFLASVQSKKAVKAPTKKKNEQVRKRVPRSIDDILG